MDNFFEMLMVLFFGISWPVNIYKAWKAKSTQGISLLFYFFIWLGYVFGIAAKIIKYTNGGFTPGYVWFFYIINIIMVTIGIIIYFRNRSLEKKNGAELKNK